MAQSQCRPCEPRPAEGDVGDRELPHGSARRPCRALRGLRAHADRLQLLPQPALPEVPGRRRARNGSPRARPSCCPCRTIHVVFTLPAPIADIAYQNKAVVYDLLFKAAAETLLTIAADPKHLGARIGITAVLHTWGSAHDPSPARPHDRARRRHLARRRALGVVPARLLPAGARALAPVPTAVPGEAARRTPGRPPEVLRRSRRSRRRAGVRGLSGTATPSRMGGLCQAPVRRATGRAGLSVALHPPRRHRQQPADRLRPAPASPSDGRTIAPKVASARRS